MERKVSVYPFPFGTRVFMHRNGVIREAEYRGMRIKDTGICGNNVDTEHIFWFGSKLGEEKFKVSMPIYKTAEDAAQETNPVHSAHGSVCGIGAYIFTFQPRRQHLVPQVHIPATDRIEMSRLRQPAGSTQPAEPQYSQSL